MNRIERHLEGVRWLNFWDKMDPVSGPLDFYEGVENTEVDTGAGRFRAHSAYWGHPPVQEKILWELLAAEGAPSSTPAATQPAEKSSE